ncbi:MAG TPA: extracellular solute-binding protein [Candidatus Anaerofilum excrementigallinarum]|nr:extracellular solute-binding protein [Candidatus Anaerofilum excrementigallinarum]
MKKRVFATLCAGMILAGSLAGCGGASTDSAAGGNSSGAQNAEGKTTLNVLWWGSQTRHEQTTAMLEKFEELNPDIDVVMDYSDWDGYWTKLPAQVAGGQTPDVFQMDYAYLSQYANNGVLAELDSYIADGSLDMSNVEQNILDSGTVNGKVYAISTGTNAPVMLYRKDLVDELGLELPMNPTLTQYMDVAKAVYEATGLRDTFITGCTSANLNFYLRNYGMNFFNDEGNGLGFDDPQYIVDMWELALKAQEEGWGLKPGEGTSTTAFDSMVVEAWSRQQNSNELQAYRDATGKDISMVMIPTMEDATTPNSYLKPAMYWCVGADSEVKDAAVRFINFFTNNTECYDIVGIERAVPISSEMREYVAPNLDEVSQEAVDFIDYVSQPDKTSPIMNPDPAVGNEVDELMNQYSEQVRYGEITDLQAAAQQFMDEANQILAEGAAAE